MSNPTPILNNINAFDATKGTTISFNIIGGTDIVRSNIVYIYDLSTNDLICTHLYISTESIHELPPNTDSSIVYASGKSSADFVNNKNYYLQIQTFTNTAGTAGGSGMSVAKTFWCLFNPALSVNAIPAAISTTSYNVGATYTTNITDVTIPVTNIIQQYKFDLYTATGTLVQTSGNIIGSGEQEGTSTTYNITYNFSGLVVNSSYYVVVTTTSTEGMTVSAQSNTFTVSIETPTVGAATATNNSCDGYISVVSNLSSEYGGNVGGETVTFNTDSVNNVSSLKVDIEPTQLGSGTPSPTNVRPIVGLDNVEATITNGTDTNTYSQEFDVSLSPTVTNTEPYFFKATGDVRGDRLTENIVGGTVGWNQQMSTSDWSTRTVSGVTFTNNGDGSYQINGTATGNSFVTVQKQFVNGHVYYLNGCPEGGSRATYFLDSGANLGGSDVGNGFVGKCRNNTGDYYVRMYVMQGTTVDNLDVVPVLIDLTAMFGSTIADYIYSLEQAHAGDGVAWFRNYFTKDYYPYDPGTLRSVEGVSAHETVGFNQWDEEWESGYINNSTGEFVASQNYICTKNFISIVPGKSYYIKTPVALKLIAYDSNKTFLRAITSTWANEVISGSAHLSDVYYIKFYNAASGASTTYNHDICINLSDPTRNGEYEPYQKHTYPLDSSLTLRGVPKLVDGKLAFDGDVYPPSGEVQRRYGVVDLGTLNWAGSQTLWSAQVSLNHTNGTPAICSQYEDVGNVSTSSMTNGQIQTRSNYVFICDTNYTDAASFKTAMNGVQLCYELATPTTETADGYEQYQRCDPSGTEEFVTTGIVPVGHETTYLTRDIFSGTLDLATGVLTVTWGSVDMGSLSWGYTTLNGVGAFYVLRNDAKLPSSNGVKANMLASAYDIDTANNVYTNTSDGRMSLNTSGYFQLRDSRYSNANAFKTAVTGQTICYELATPQTYQLTPHQIQTLVGQNNVWSDAGDVDVTFNLPISNLLVKRQDASDVSGDWLTLYSQPITQASDMDFTYIDFLNQHGKTYRYALVPLLTQQQGDIDVEIEGGYTVSDDVLSVFDGVFIANSNGAQKLKANTEYGDLETNQDVGVLTTIGGKYPFVVSNSNLNYHSGSISALIVPSDFYTDGDLDRLDIVERREAIEQFLTDKTAKILKDWNGNIWLITFIDNVEVSFVDDYGMGLGTLSAKWVEIGDVNDQTDLQQTGLI